MQIILYNLYDCNIVHECTSTLLACSGTIHSGTSLQYIELGWEAWSLNYDISTSSIVIHEPCAILHAWNLPLNLSSCSILLTLWLPLHQFLFHHFAMTTCKEWVLLFLGWKICHFLSSVSLIPLARLRIFMACMQQWVFHVQSYTSHEVFASAKLYTMALLYQLLGDCS